MKPRCQMTGSEAFFVFRNLSYMPNFVIPETCENDEKNETLFSVFSLLSCFSEQGIICGIREILVRKLQGLRKNIYICGW